MSPTHEGVTDDQRIGVAWRELRRGASMQRLRELFHGPFELAQVDALDLLVQRGACRMSELAEALRVDASTATRTVGRLVNAGLVDRIADADDARAVRVELTVEGAAVQTEIADRRRVLFDRILEGFSPEERHSLANLLERLVAGVDAVVEGAGEG